MGVKKQFGKSGKRAAKEIGANMPLVGDTLKSDKTVTFKFTAKSYKGGKIILSKGNIGGMKHGNIKM